MDFGDRDNMVFADRDRLTIRPGLRLGLLQFYHLAIEYTDGETATASNLIADEVEEYLEKFFKTNQRFVEDLLSEAREMSSVTVPLKRLELADEWKPASVPGPGTDL